jgi:low affinity Fe/Cu permease
VKERGFFDRFAAVVAHNVARAWFFSACVLLVILWAPSIFAIGDVDTWQLIINTATTIVTFLLVALFQNTQERFEQGTIKKLDHVLAVLDRADPVEHERLLKAVIVQLDKIEEKMSQETERPT